ncbi:MAG: hypothetical protein ACKPKO_05610, partial [Candidatus Fonsibacter sp.]
NPYCDSCRRANMNEKSKYAGSYQNTAIRWGELVTGDHITSTHDNMLGIEGGKDVLVMRDAYSGLKAAYPMPDKTAASTMMAIQHFRGNRDISRFYSDRSGEIERALRVLHITSDTSQPDVPQDNAVAERLVQDVLEGTRTTLLRAGVPPCLWEFACA